MADKQPKDNELSTNKEVKRLEAFQDGVDLKEEAMEITKELLVKTTEEEFAKLGYEKSNKEAGFYGTGKAYGAGVEDDKFSVGLEGKTKSNITKKVTFGARRLQSDVNFEYHKNHITIEYVSTEQGFFVGAGKRGRFAINDKITVDTTDKTDLKKKIKEFFKMAALKEIGYLTNMKLGVEETKAKTNVSENTQPISMKKMTIKSLFSLDSTELNEGKKDKEIEKNKKVNTVKDEKTGKTIFFDEKKDTKKNFKTIDEREVEIKKETESTVSEISMSGPAGTGAGAFLTPHAFKKDFKDTPYFKNKNNKKPKVDKNYNVVPQKENFWTPAKVDPNTHVQGHPGMKPGSAAELKMASKGLRENVELDLTKKKFFTIKENQEQGINKRYLITEKTSEEYLKERWGKLVNIKTGETIKEAEEMSLVLENAKNNIKDVIDEIVIEEQVSLEQAKGQTPEILAENVDSKGEETVTVLKPGSTFGIEYTFLKKDFINESKRYILELNSRVYVQNPNSI